MSVFVVVARGRETKGWLVGNNSVDPVDGFAVSAVLGNVDGVLKVQLLVIGRAVAKIGVARFWKGDGLLGERRWWF